jgi:hypothetical protein
MVCVMDFGGSYTTSWGLRVYPFNCWADWDGTKTVFGGAYAEVPDMHSDTEPTEQQVEEWVKKHWNERAWFDGMMANAE